MAARNELHLQRCSPSELFRAVFCACGEEKAPLVLDVRPKAAFARSHVAGAYCVRTSANGAALLDYSGGGQARPWAHGTWHDCPLLLIAAGGDDDDPPLDKRHPVAAFLIAEGAARSLAVVKGGFAAVSAEYPFVCGGWSAVARYPSEVIPRQLFLGDWAHAEDHAVLRQLRISHLLTIHNMPGTLRVPPPGVTHLRQELADAETEDIASHLGAAVEFITAALAGGGRVLVHCGAGVSRSATLVAAYLCLTRRCSSATALAELKMRRSCVAPNAGFVRQLDAFARVQSAAPPVVVAVPDSQQRGDGAWLEVSKDGDVVSRIQLPPPPASFTVGRAAGVGLSLEHASISRNHASLTWHDGHWWLRDAGSAHGTFHDGHTSGRVRLTNGVEVPLSDGAKMSFGASTRVVLFRTSRSPAAQKRRSRSRSRSPQRQRH